MKRTRYIKRLVAAEISTLTRYCDRLILWLPREDDGGELFEQVRAPHKVVVQDGEPFPNCTDEQEKRTVILLDGVLNFESDIQGLLSGLQPSLARNSRVYLVCYNPYFGWLYRLANLLHLRKGDLPTSFLTKVDLDNIAGLSGFRIVRTRTAGFVPWRLFGIGTLINRLLAATPILRWLGFTYLAVLAPVVAETRRRPSLSCVVPAMNERGNIEVLLNRMPDLGCELEMIFVEGHSTDGTWEEIQRVAEVYKDRFSIQTYQQPGRGKKDAVRLGFSHASGDLLTILDADMTMPPERLVAFYQAYLDGHADFINGSRLVYQFDGDAMRFLNRLGNIFFAKTLSCILDVRLSDSLCGTKLVSRHDYRRMTAWREDFGDFDPFGDFELLFPAAVIGLGVVNLPIRYSARTYGSTNISRFRHGLELLKMTTIGLFRIKIGPGIDDPDRKS